MEAEQIKSNDNTKVTIAKSTKSQSAVLLGSIYAVTLVSTWRRVIESAKPLITNKSIENPA